MREKTPQKHRQNTPQPAHRALDEPNAAPHREAGRQGRLAFFGPDLAGSALNTRAGRQWRLARCERDPGDQGASRAIATRELRPYPPAVALPRLPSLAVARAPAARPLPLQVVYYYLY